MAKPYKKTKQKNKYSMCTVSCTCTHKRMIHALLFLGYCNALLTGLPKKLNRLKWAQKKLPVPGLKQVKGRTSHFFRTDFKMYYYYVQQGSEWYSTSIVDCLPLYTHDMLQRTMERQPLLIIEQNCGTDCPKTFNMQHVTANSLKKHLKTLNLAFM